MAASGVVLVVVAVAPFAAGERGLDFLTGGKIGRPPTSPPGDDAVAGVVVVVFAADGVVFVVVEGAGAR